MCRSYVCASRSSRRRMLGFTLVELLVVVAIIALLISILLPSLQKARESAYSVKCGANEKSFGNAVALYQSDYNGIFPYGIEHSADEFQSTGNFGDAKPPQQLVFTYTKGVGIFQDPKAPTGDQHVYKWWAFSNAPDIDASDCSYMFSEGYLHRFTRRTGQPMASSHIRRPEQFGYMSGGIIVPNGSWHSIDVNVTGPNIIWSGGLRVNWTHNGDLLNPNNPGHSNFLFGDLHVESLNRQGRNGRDIGNVVFNDPRDE